MKINREQYWILRYLLVMEETQRRSGSGLVSGVLLGDLKIRFKEKNIKDLIKEGPVSIDEALFPNNEVRVTTSGLTNMYLEKYEEYIIFIKKLCLRILVGFILALLLVGVNLIIRNISAGIMQSHIERYHKQEYNSIGGKNENSSKQTTSISQNTKTNTQVVLSKDLYGRNREGDKFKRISDTTNNTRKQLESSKRTILQNALPSVAFEKHTIVPFGTSSRTELLPSLPNKEEIQGSKGKTDGME